MTDEAKTYYFHRDSHLIISNFLKKYIKNDCIIFCIGTDRFIGDCLGPLIGTFLSKLDIPTPVFGTLDNPVHATNISKNIIEVKKRFPNHRIIAIDACLGTSDSIGSIHIKIAPIHPGKGVGKKLPSVGDISIIGIVDSAENGEFLSMHNTRLSLVMRMAEVITRGIYVGLGTGL